MSDPKLCIDCRFLLEVPGIMNPICDHPKAHRSLVDGKSDQICALARAVSGKIGCGPEGNWWEPKPVKEENAS